MAEKNERLQSQLRSLKEDLANTRDDQVKGFFLSRFLYSVFFSLTARDYNGQDPPRECEAGERQVQDPEGSEEREYQEEGGPV